MAASLGERARGVLVDMRDRASVERLLDDAGQVDVLVNNAARTVFRPLWEINQDEWDDVLATNLRGVFFGCQLAGPRMREQGWGRILNMASISGQAVGASGAHYAASKAGIIVLTKIVAAELAPHGVTCNALAPAAVRTPAFDVLSEERLESRCAGESPWGASASRPRSPSWRCFCAPRRRVTSRVRRSTRTAAC